MYVPAIIRTRPTESNSGDSSSAPRKLLAANAAMRHPTDSPPKYVLRASPKVKKTRCRGTPARWCGAGGGDRVRSGMRPIDRHKASVEAHTGRIPGWCLSIGYTGFGQDRWGRLCLFSGAAARPLRSARQAGRPPATRPRTVGG